MTQPYRPKTSRYSSHSLVLELCGEEGSGRRLLDLGCGPGHVSRLLAGRGFEVTGVDKAPPETPAGPGLQFLAGDLEHGIPEGAGRFDIVVCGDVLEHLRDPGRLLREIAGVLLPGGKLIASLPNSGNLYFRLTVAAGRFPKHDYGLFDRTHLHFYVWDGWLDLFRQNGFEIVLVKPSGVPVGLAVSASEDSTIVRVAEWCSHAAARIWKRMFAYQFVVEAKLEQP
ncbi:MAG: class I SAM-dependent methyltransferase [Bryobacteraceae bacterium]